MVKFVSLQSNTFMPKSCHKNKSLRYMCGFEAEAPPVIREAGFIHGGALASKPLNRYGK